MEPKINPPCGDLNVYGTEKWFMKHLRRVFIKREGPKLTFAFAVEFKDCGRNEDETWQESYRPMKLEKRNMTSCVAFPMSFHSFNTSPFVIGLSCGAEDPNINHDVHFEQWLHFRVFFRDPNSDDDTDRREIISLKTRHYSSVDYYVLDYPPSRSK